ncbi:MAG: hypothetical protein IT371_08810 [Deltaproteobacteria bacterium]|nr:hypothetical protein [Deltaproteobacteria bacterium]
MSYLRAVAILFGLSACGSSPGGSTPGSGKVLLGSWTPRPGASSQTHDTAIFVTIGNDTGLASVATEAASTLGQHFELWDLTNGQLVTTTRDAGSPNGDPRNTMLRLRAASPLRDGHEYGLRLLPHPSYEVLGVPNGELTHFYVGPRPRVREIVLKSSGGASSPKGPGPARTTLAVEFSESVESRSLSGALTLTNLATGQSLTPPLLLGGGSVGSVGLDLHSLPIWNPSQRLRLTLANSISGASGNALDGKNQMPGGSPADFELIFEPSELEKVTPGRDALVTYACGYSTSWGAGPTPTLPRPSCAALTVREL